MARRNQRRGDWLVTDDYTGFTQYGSRVKKDFWGNYAVRPLERNLKEIATPLSDPTPVPFYRGPSYEFTPTCVGELAPFYVGNTTVPTNPNNAAIQALDLFPAIPNMEIGCNFIVYPDTSSPSGFDAGFDSGFGL